MRPIFTILMHIVLAGMMFTACSKSQEAKSTQDINFSIGASGTVTNATIVQEDQRKCMCCGGYFLTINGQKPIAGQYFLTYDFPGGYKPTSFPVKVYIEWEKDPKACINDKVIIKRIVIIK